MEGVAHTFTGLERWNSPNHTKTSTFAPSMFINFHQNSLKFCWLGEIHNYFVKTESFFGAILFFTDSRLVYCDMVCANFNYNLGTFLPYSVHTFYNLSFSNLTYQSERVNIKKSLPFLYLSFSYFFHFKIRNIKLT